MNRKARSLHKTQRLAIALPVPRLRMLRRGPPLDKHILRDFDTCHGLCHGMDKVLVAKAKPEHFSKSGNTTK